MSNDELLSYLGPSQPNSLVYSLLASYASQRGGEVPGSWLVGMLEPLGVRAETVRQALYRMVKSGTLATRSRGPFKLYRLTAMGRAGTDAGTGRMLRPPEPGWDEQWTLVNYQFQSNERVLRDLVRSLLVDREGFASLSRGTLLHPRNPTGRICAALGELDLLDRVSVFTARNVVGESNDSLLHRLWPIAEIEAGYSRFIRTFSRYTRRNWGRHDPLEALQLRFAFVLCFLQTAWRDPGLPLQLLPKSWPARRAQAIAAELYRMLEPPLMQMGDSLLERLGFPVPSPKDLVS